MSARRRIFRGLLAGLLFTIVSSASALAAETQLSLDVSNNGSWQVGSQYEIAVSISDQGFAAATGVVLNGTLLAPAGVVWEADPDAPLPGSCTLSAVSGGQQTLQCILGLLVALR
jgi:hypothetical protein